MLSPCPWTVLFHANGNCDLQSDIEGSVKQLESVGAGSPHRRCAKFIPLYLFAGLATVIGVKGVFTRTSIEIDRNSGTIRFFRTFLTTSMRELPFSEITHVLHGTEAREISVVKAFRRFQLSDHNKIEVFSYQLWYVAICTRTRETHAIRTGLNQLAIRSVAEELSKFLEVPLRDMTGLKTIVREPGKLDDPHR